MSTFTSNGSRLYLGTTAAATDATSFGADTYVEVPGVESLGDIGDEAAIVSFKVLAENRVRKLKGSLDGGTLELVLAADFMNAGQTALRTAATSRHPFNFKIVLDDAPVGGTATTIFFRALVASGKVGIGEADAEGKLNFSLAVDSAQVIVPAAED